GAVTLKVKVLVESAESEAASLFRGGASGQVEGGHDGGIPLGDDPRLEGGVSSMSPWVTAPFAAAGFALRRGAAIFGGDAALTGTVWDAIKPTGGVYEHTVLPRSFELTVGSEKYWVAPNASEHMWENLTKSFVEGAGTRAPQGYKSLTHSMPVATQVE